MVNTDYFAALSNLASGDELCWLAFFQMYRKLNIKTEIKTWTENLTLKFIMKLNKCSIQAQAPAQLRLSSIIFIWRGLWTVHASVHPSHSLAQPPNNLLSWNLAHRSQLGGKWKAIFCNSCPQLSTAVTSCCELMKIKINLQSWNLAHISRLGCRWKFHFIFLVTTVISCQQMSSAVISCQQLSTYVDSIWKWKSI